MAEDNKRDQPAPAATAGAPADPEAAPFVDDIIIWADGLDAPRRLTHADLVKLPKLNFDLMPPINALVKQGVVVAAIPTTSGIGASCYLCNLAALKKSEDEP